MTDHPSVPPTPERTDELREAAINRCAGNGCFGSEELEEQNDHCRETFNDADFEKWCDYCLLARVIAALDAATKERDAAERAAAVVAVDFVTVSDARDAAVARAEALERELAAYRWAESNLAADAAAPSREGE